MKAGRLLGLARGFPGHPSHPPLTDATIGAFTLGVILLVLGWIGIEERETVTGAFLAIIAGLILSLPTLVTGFLDYLAIPRGTRRWRTASLHWLTMVFAVAAFMVAAALLQDGYDSGTIPAGAAIAAIVAEIVLTVGGWLGGTVVFVHGERVLDLADMPARGAAVPREIEREPKPPLVEDDRDTSG